MSFSELRLAEPIVRAVADEGYSTPTPIQALAIPEALAGRDILGCAQTGTGKTCAFALPILHRLAGISERTGRPKFKPAYGRKPRALVLCPTRELASQIFQSFVTYGAHLDLRHTVVFGGVSQHHQVRHLRDGVDVLVATPGRLLDLINQGHIDLRHIESLVLDEADRMLDMGFIPDIRLIVGMLPAGHQTLFFSATVSREIRSLADMMLNDPVSIETAPESTTVEAIEQFVHMIDRAKKPFLLQHLLGQDEVGRTLVFTKTRHGADKVVKHLHRVKINAESIHGDKSQNARTRAMNSFKKGATQVLVATDIASRGIDVDGVTHVINYDIPIDPESYVHRIGRTARAGATGVAISFCSREEVGLLRSVERRARVKIEVAKRVENLPSAPPAAAGDYEPTRERSRDRSRDDRSRAGSGAGYNKSRSYDGGWNGKPSSGGQHKSHSNRDQSSKRSYDGGWNGKPSNSGYNKSNSNDGGGYNKSRSNEGGGYNGKPSDGGYKKQYSNDGGYNKSNSDGGGYNKSRSSEGGGYNGKPSGGGYKKQYSNDGGYNKSNSGGGGYNKSNSSEGGGYSGKPSGGGYKKQYSNDGGYNKSNSGGGGYNKSRSSEGGGYNGKPSGGGYKSNSGGGGYKSNSNGGGYNKSRSNEGGSYSGKPSGGGSYNKSNSNGGGYNKSRSNEGGSYSGKPSGGGYKSNSGGGGYSKSNSNGGSYNKSRSNEGGGYNGKPSGGGYKSNSGGGGYSKSNSNGGGYNKSRSNEGGGYNGKPSGGGYQKSNSNGGGYSKSNSSGGGYSKSNSSGGGGYSKSNSSGGGYNKSRTGTTGGSYGKPSGGSSRGPSRGRKAALRAKARSGR